eukprot:6209653-Pleurochrysis_carterae.AAC.2
METNDAIPGGATPLLLSRRMMYGNAWPKIKIQKKKDCNQRLQKDVRSNRKGSESRVTKVTPACSPR